MQHRLSAIRKVKDHHESSQKERDPGRFHGDKWYLTYASKGGFVDRMKQREEDFLQQLEAESPNVRSAAFYKQRTKVFYQKQHLDEVNAKVKFFLRKIEIDQRKNEETPIL